MEEILRNKNWVFTLGKNYPDSEEIRYMPEDIRKALSDYDYVIFQLEKAPTTGYLHYQGYITNSRQISRNTIAKRLPGIHLEPRCAPTHKQAIDYCRKEETRVEGPWSYGIEPKDRENQGTSTDLTSFMDDVENGVSKDDLIENIHLYFLDIDIFTTMLETHIMNL